MYVCVSERTMDLMVTLQNNVSSGLLWSSVSGRQLGKLEPCTDLALRLSVVAVRTGLLVCITRSRSTQPCIPPGSFDRVPASAGVRAGMSPLPGGR